MYIIFEVSFNSMVQSDVQMGGNHGRGGCISAPLPCSPNKTALTSTTRCHFMWQHCPERHTVTHLITDVTLPARITRH